MAGHELVEAAQVHRFTTVVDEGSNAVLFGFALVVVMVVMFVVMMMLVVVLLVLMVVMFFVIVVIVILFMVSLNGVNPGCRGGHLVEVEHAGVEYLAEVDVAVVTIDDFCLGLDGADNLADAP